MKYRQCPDCKAYCDCPREPEAIEVSKTKALPEYWHVQIAKNGALCGQYQFFHPNPEAARVKAEELRKELPWAEVHVACYRLHSVESKALDS